MPLIWSFVTTTAVHLLAAQLQAQHDFDDQLAHSQAGALKSLVTWMMLFNLQKGFSIENFLFWFLNYLAYT